MSAMKTGVLLCLLLTASGVEALPAWLAAEPNYSLDFELVSVQGELPFAPHPLLGCRFARVTCSVGRVRAGTALTDAWLEIRGGDPSVLGAPLPLELDVNLYRHSPHSGRLYWSAPDIYLSTAFEPIWSPASSIKVGITCDYAAGVGIGLEAFYLHSESRWKERVDRFCIGLRLSAGVARIRLGPEGQD
jgi:hypothetical protein